MSEAYKQDESWIELQSKLGGHKEWLHAQAIMRVEIAPVNVAAVRDLVDALEVLCRVGIEVEATLAARDAELAALRAEIERLTAGLETIVALTKHDEPGVGEVFSPGGVEAVLVLKGTNRPLERMNEKLAALRLRYREALEVMNHLYRNVLGPASPKCDGCAEEIAEALAQINPVLSTPEAIAIIKEGQS